MDINVRVNEDRRKKYKIKESEKKIKQSLRKK